MTLATIIALAAEESEHHGNVALETVGYGIVAVVVFAALALVTLSYRNVANRHSHKAEAYARAHADDVQRAGHGH
jgi:NADH:ubiquinone oxidoreductase subunit 2 (subunit N)